ncbi:MAG: glycerol-3-phosphate 1-O-acyltransferase PlsY [Planctomycetota bacterium]|nr:glycerol-3-phosphate 1-O-acyltransferase PlsY [Planctomycetota bacterium]MDA1163091.1 glycerol-3-phosphate 1-O-acyltransferase PlsY [Planctomycetota bacterium]
MTSPVAELITAALAYLCGSIPFGLLIARAVAGVDIRQQGSGNIGATNVGRVLGARWGIAALLLDAQKGLLPVLLIPRCFAASDTGWFVLLQVTAGVATVVGHMFPVWLKFRGGKGVATSLGVVTVLTPVGSLAAFAGFAMCMFASRIVALSSIVAALVFAIGQMFILQPNPFAVEKLPLSVFSLAVPALIVLQHRSNIGRLMRGEEKQFQFGKSKGKDAAKTADESSGPTSADSI